MAVSDLSPFFAIPPSEHLAGNASAFAIAAPDSPVAGHSLLVSRRLIETWWQATPQEQADLLLLVGDVKRLLDDEHGPTGYTVGFDSGHSAGQQIPHLHLHVIPRFGSSAARGVGSLTASESLDGGVVRLADGTSAPLGPALLSLLETSTYDRVDLVVSFVMESGLKVIADPLADAVERGSQLRVLTTDYLYRTEPRALRLLHDLGTEYPGRVQLRVFESRGVRSFHPKGYLFHSSTDDQAAAWVGSSNLSASGLEGGIEWNVGLDTVRPMLETFEELWTHAWTVPLTERWIQEYQRHRPFSRTAPPPPGLLDPSTAVDLAAETTTPTDDSGIQELVPAGVDPADVTVEVAQPYTPRELQAEALTALEATRADGHRAGLVVMATGLGKTWLAAFDTARPQFGRVLFLAHREEILRQSLDVFRKVQPDRSLGMFMAQEREEDSDVVFASVQTLHRHLDEFEASDFDYVVVDEFHHAAASSYRKVIDHFDPAFLLGLTATPERMDGADLLGLCGDNLVYEANLVEGINRNELVPFEYHGIKDIVDFVPIPWRNGKFDPAMLSAAIETHDRAAHAHREWASRAGQRTLAFCQTTAHADFMAEWFRQQGLRTASVHSKPSSDPRRGSVRKLENGELDVLFAVDVFNEGFDLPAIDTVLMLRPTDSPVIFLQQLGRGLRLGDHKEKLVVVDFIGNHRSFLSKPRTLLGLGVGGSPSTADVLKALDEHEWNLPEGCSVEWELEALDLLRELTSDQLKQEPGSELIRWVQDYTEQFGHRPTALQAFVARKDPATARRRHGSWFRMLELAGVLEADEAQLIEQHQSLLEPIERAAMTRSYKMVALKALLRTGRSFDRISVADLAEASRRMIAGDPRLVQDVTSGRTNPDPQSSADPTGWESFWRRNPLHHWAKSTDVFDMDDDTFGLVARIPNADRASVEGLIEEIVEWRLAEYLDHHELRNGGEIQCRVVRDKGNPVVQLRRKDLPSLPGGRADFIADGTRYNGSFTKDALRTARVDGRTGNVLPALLRGWFGPHAGHPAREDHVAFRLRESGWEVVPSQEREGVPTPFFGSYSVACGPFIEADDDPTSSGIIRLSDAADAARDEGRLFVVCADGDSMKGGADPVSSGDLLLMRWTENKSRQDLIGQRVLVEMSTDGGKSAVLKRLDRDGDGYVLRSDNPDSAPIRATRGMRIVGELIRALGQEDLNPLAKHVGEVHTRGEIPVLYGRTYNPKGGTWRFSGHIPLESDIVLFVNLRKQNADWDMEYKDYFVDQHTFVWSSQSRTSPESTPGRDILEAPGNGKRIHLWVRDTTGQGLEYRGLVLPQSHEGAKPMSVRFKLMTPLAPEDMTRLAPAQTSTAFAASRMGDGDA